MEGGYSNRNCAHMQGNTLQILVARVDLEPAAPASRRQGTRKSKQLKNEDGQAETQTSLSVYLSKLAS